jgi:3-methyl-2-oxobutanoate hydroxymethyltransferase
MSRAETYLQMKQRGDKVVVVTGYDAPTARFEAEAGVDIILVGDSVGTNVLGYSHEREVKLSDIYPTQPTTPRRRRWRARGGSRKPAPTV